MSDNIKHLDLDSEEFESAPRALRQYAEKLKKTLDAANQTITGFREKETDSALGEVLTGFKSPAKVKRDLLTDGIDPLDNEAVAAWIEQNGDDYARGEGAAPVATSDPATAEAAAGYDRLNAVQQMAQPADLSRHEVAFAGITPDMDGKAVLEHFKRMGI